MWDVFTLSGAKREVTGQYSVDVIKDLLSQLKGSTIKLHKKRPRKRGFFWHSACLALHSVKHVYIASRLVKNQRNCVTNMAFCVAKVYTVAQFLKYHKK